VATQRTDRYEARQGNANQVEHARKLLADRNITIKEVAASLGVNRATIYRALGLRAVGVKAGANRRVV
jgi:AcrR family transcriptional regulator